MTRAEGREAAVALWPQDHTSHRQGCAALGVGVGLADATSGWEGTVGALGFRLGGLTGPLAGPLQVGCRR